MLDLRSLSTSRGQDWNSDLLIPNFILLHSVTINERPTLCEILNRASMSFCTKTVNMI